MSGLGRWLYYSLLFLFASARIAIGQTDLALIDLPQVELGKSSELKLKSSFPNICFGNLVFGEDGQLYLLTCSSARPLNLHLFQFDGVNFHPLLVDQDEFTEKANVNHINSKGDLLYVGESQNGMALFNYNIGSGETTIVLDSMSKVRQRRSGARTVFTSIGAEQSTVLILDELGNREKCVIRNDAINASGFEPLGVHDGYLWMHSSEDRVVLQYDITEQRVVKTYPMGELIPDETIPDRYQLRITSLARGLYLTYSSGSKAILTIFDSAKSEFHAWPYELAFTKNISLFEDDVHNVLMVVETHGRTNRIYLLDENQRPLVDYAIVDTKLQGRNILDIKAHDFREEIYVSSAGGLFIASFKRDLAIKSFYRELSCRKMVSTGAQSLLVANSRNVFNVVDLVNGTYTPYVFDTKRPTQITMFDHGPDSFYATHDSTIYIYNPSTGSVAEFITLGTDVMHQTRPDNGEVFIIDMLGRLKYYDKNSGFTKLATHGNDTIIFERQVHEMVRASNGHLWIASVNGLYHYNPLDQALENLSSVITGLTSTAMCLVEDNEGKIWVGSAIHGLQIFNPYTQEVRTVNTTNGLGNNTIVSIVKDQDGFMWVGTYNGVSVLTPEGEVLTHLNTDDGIVYPESNRQSKLKLPDGRIAIGTIRGLTLLDPKRIKAQVASNREFKIYTTSTTLFDAQQQRNITKWYPKGIDESIRVPARSKNIEISVGTTDYLHASEVVYAYRVLGYQDDWTFNGNNQKIALSNIPGGKYRVEIKARNRSGQWTDNTLLVDAHVKQYFYESKYFLAALVGFAILAAFVWIQSLRVQVRLATAELAHDKEVIEGQAAQLRELDVAKSKFFTNISHEFRTPLTIISAMMDRILSDPDTWAVKGGKTIKQNTGQLLDLINQILDLRKLESNKLQLNLTQGNVIAYLQYIVESYQTFALDMGQSLHFTNTSGDMIMDYDAEKLLRVMSNLLTNAIKFNRPGGNIYLHLDHILAPREELAIRVQDTGQGIPADRIENIFGRYYQVNEPGQPKVAGSGIGLALTKELVELMGGNISVESKHGTGTIFFINLPITRNAPLKTVAPLNTTLDIAMPEISGQEPPRTEESLPIDTNSPRILVIEDNRQIMNILKSCLGEEYTIRSAFDGSVGVRMALAEIPDIIITDVMMPGKSGYEVAEIMKKDIRTSHIPIVMLTAKSDIDSRLEGLSLGADAYLDKPFNEKELLLTIANMLENRRLLQERYLSGMQAADSSNTPTIEDDFLTRAKGAIMDNIDDEEFNVARLCRAVNLGRSQLHHKLKALTGLSASLFIRSVKMEHARRLLDTSDLTVSQIGYAVGFKSVSYFSTVFHDYFSMAPSQYRAQTNRT